MAAAAWQLMLPATRTRQAHCHTGERGEIGLFFAFAILFGLD